MSKEAVKGKAKEVKEEKSTVVMSAADQKKMRLAKLADFESVMLKKYGDEILQNGGVKKEIKVDTITTGAISLDVALGVGGLPKGRVVEIYGPEASGKTTVTLQVIAQAQRQGGICGFVDAEQALDVSYAKLLGVKFDETLQIASPEYGEQALDLVRHMAESGAFDVIVLDSVAALVPKAEIEATEGIEKNVAMGLMARNMSKALRILTPIAKQNNVLIIFINQTREKIGVMYGSPETTTGGNSLKFYASVRLRVRKSSEKISLKVNGEEKDGYKMVVKIVKNKLNSPQEDVELPIIYGMGIDSNFDLFSAAKALEVIKIAGRTHTFAAKDGERVLGKSSDEALQMVRSDEALSKEIDKAVRKQMLEKK
jgi:recombination protein RecA